MQILEARSAIADLVHTYALNIRKANGIECAPLFTDDAVFEIKEAPFGNDASVRTRTSLQGREAITAYLVRAASADTRVCPLIHNLLIQVDGDEAASSCVMTSLVWPSGQQILGEYQDRYRYEGSWRFHSRQFTMFGELPAQR